MVVAESVGEETYGELGGRYIQFLLEYHPTHLKVLTLCIRYSQSTILMVVSESYGQRHRKQSILYIKFLLKCKPTTF